MIGINNAVFIGVLKYNYAITYRILRYCERRVIIII